MRAGDVTDCPRCGKKLTIEKIGSSWGVKCANAYCGHRFGYTRERLKEVLTGEYTQRKLPLPAELQGDQMSLFD